MKVGKASYNKGFTKKNWFKMKDGDNVYRILPPLFDFAEKGKWSEFYKIEYGYTNSQGQIKPFPCNRVVNPKTKMVEVECPACVKREALKIEIETLKEAFRNKKITQQQLKEEVEARRSFNLDSKHYVNAIDLNGTIGLLKIPYKAKKSLDAEIDKLRDQGIDPLSVETGRFFIFNRSGIMLDTLYSVSVYSQTINHPELGTVKKEINHVLDDATLAKLETEAFDLSKIFKKLSDEQIKDIVENGAEGVDRALGGTKVEVETEEEVEEEVIIPKIAPVVRVVPKAEAKKEVPKATPKVEQVKIAPADSAQLDEDWLKSLGL